METPFLFVTTIIPIPPPDSFATRQYCSATIHAVWPRNRGLSSTRVKIRASDQEVI